jgi:hypothetical protein
LAAEIDRKSGLNGHRRPPGRAYFDEVCDAIERIGQPIEPLRIAVVTEQKDPMIILESYLRPQRLN